MRAGIALATAFCLTGCVTLEVTEITLSGVVRSGQAVRGGTVPPEAAQLERNGAIYHVEPSMTMQPGDALSTGPDTAAVITYPGGARAYIYPSTRVRIGSLIDEIGKVFIKVKGAFRVKTEFVTAGSEGTQYWVDVKEPDQVKVVVVEHAVKLSSNTTAWPAQTLQANQQAIIGGAAPGVVTAADPIEITRETNWVKSMDQLVPVQTTISPWAIGAAVILIPIIVHQVTRGDRQSPPSPTSDHPPSSSGQPKATDSVSPTPGPAAPDRTQTTPQQPRSTDHVPARPPASATTQPPSSSPIK